MLKIMYLHFPFKVYYCKEIFGILKNASLPGPKVVCPCPGKWTTATVQLRVLSN